MSTPKKKISKKSSKSVPSMADLCTQRLWQQSIAAGKADELVAMLMECEEGKAALKKAIPPPVDCIIINRICNDHSFTAYVRRNKKTEFLFMLVEQYENTDQPAHLLGGFDITWESEDDVTDWIEEMVGKMSPNDARRYFKLTLGFDVPERDDGGEIVDVVAYIRRNCRYGIVQGEEWNQTSEEKAKEILMETVYPTADGKSVIFNTKELRELEKNGVRKRHLAVFTIMEEYF